MSYVQIALIPVPVDKRDEYLDHARLMAAIFREHGATQIGENWGTDLSEGKQTDFYRAVAAVAGETVVVAWIHWPDKAASEAAMAAMRTDERMANFSMPFDGSRMIFGGFEPMRLDA